MGFPGGWELVLIVGVLVLLFGATKLPQMARSLGQSARVFKAEARGMKDDEEAAERAKDGHDKHGQDDAGSAEPRRLTSGDQDAATSAQPIGDKHRSDIKNPDIKNHDTQNHDTKN